MNFFDSAVFQSLNSLAGRSEFLDILILSAAHNPLLKGGVLAALLWWAWSSAGDDVPERRARVLAAVLVSLPAIALARLLAVVLPFRLRPMHEEGIGFTAPYGLDTGILDGWSSFPSDHAVLFFTLAAGIFCLSRRAGVFALAYASIFICLPRVYLGLHYPTDIAAGAAIGLVMGWAGTVYMSGNGKFRASIDWLNRRPAILYPALFLVTYQIADLFSSGRGLMRGLVKLVRIAVS